MATMKEAYAMILAAGERKCVMFVFVFFVYVLAFALLSAEFGVGVVSGGVAGAIAGLVYLGISTLFGYYASWMERRRMNYMMETFVRSAFATAHAKEVECDSLNCEYGMLLKEQDYLEKSIDFYKELTG